MSADIMLPDIMQEDIMEATHVFGVGAGILTTCVIMGWLGWKWNWSQRFRSCVDRVGYAATYAFTYVLTRVFFKSIVVVGEDNVPREGPVILIGNHSNQFADVALLISSTRRALHFLIADSSYQTPLVGTFARLSGAIPVFRPQDASHVPQSGRLRVLHDREGHGEQGTRFVEWGYQPGDVVVVTDSGSAKIKQRQYVVVEVVSDTKLLLRLNGRNHQGPAASPRGGAFPAGESGGAFTHSKRVDNARSLQAVLGALKRSRCVALFPEGGSHDRTDLLPLKAGVAKIAFTAQQLHGMSVPIVPVGLTYRRGHRFRARVVMEFGEPLHLLTEETQLWNDSPDRACVALLNRVEHGMRATLTTTPTRGDLAAVHAARRLHCYRTDHVENDKSAYARLQIDKRIAHNMRELAEHARCLRKRLLRYQAELDEFGVCDHHVAEDETRRHGAHVALVGVRLLCVLPMYFFATVSVNGPIGLVSRYLARSHQREALQKSKVKVEAKDVVLSRKMALATALFPLCCLVYGMALAACSGLSCGTIGLLVAGGVPSTSMVGVWATDVVAKDATCVYTWLLYAVPPWRTQLLRIRKRRDALKPKVVEAIGPL